MKSYFPPLSLKAKLMALMVMLLGLTLGAEVLVSIETQRIIVTDTQRRVKDLARAIQISVEDLTSVSAIDHDRLAQFVNGLRTTGLQVSIASDRNLIINSSDPKLVGEALTGDYATPQAEPRQARGQLPLQVVSSPGGLSDTTLYLIPVQVENHLLGYVQVAANFADFAAPLQEGARRQFLIASVIFAIGFVLSYVLAERYVKPINTVAAAAQSIAERGLEPVAESPRRDEIGRLTRSFNEMIGQLRRAREREQELNQLERFTALGQLAGGFAHEIKNPLNFVSLALDQLRTRYAAQLSEEREAFLNQLAIMKDEIRRLSDLIQGFLLYGKPIEIRTAPTDMRLLVRSVLALSEPKLRSQEIKIVEEGNEVEAVLNVDAEKIRACLVNVVANALQAMPSGGELHTRFARAGDSLVVTFTDTGVGIDPEVAGRVFEPFFTTKPEGIGIGLFLSRTIVEKHGGTITVAPAQSGTGTTVTFTFPLSGASRQP
jgi:signal transduction histidine kinase